MKSAIVDELCIRKLCISKSEAKRIVIGGAVSVNGQQVNMDTEIDEEAVIAVKGRVDRGG